MSKGLLLALLVCLAQSTLIHAGEFLQPKSYTGEAGTVAIATGDFNGDGHVDVALANSTSGNVGILLGDGHGGFQTPMDFNAGSTIDSLALGDFNGDGKLDVVTINHSTNQASVLLGNGDGTLQKPLSQSTGSEPRWVAVADLNGDGKSDVVTANNDGTISVLLGNGNGTLGAFTNFAAGKKLKLLAIGDFNRDHNPDVLVADASEGVGLLLGNGDGTFRTEQVIAEIVRPTGMVVADLNADGNLDLAVNGPGLIGGAVSVLLGNGDGTFQPGTEFGVYAADGLAVGDANGDGKLDLLTGSYGFAAILPGNGDGTFGETMYLDSASGDSILAVADLNGDGQPDIVGTENEVGVASVGVLLGIGEGNFISPHGFYANPGANESVAADFNGDGKVDVAAVGGGFNLDVVSILLGNGDGTLTRNPVQFATGHIPWGVTTGDFNGDGKIDLVVSVAAGVSILLGNGDGTFQSHKDFGNAGQVYYSTVGDFNHDGKLDVAIADTVNSTVGVLLGNGDGTLQPQLSYPVGTYPYQLANGDFNGDGKLDLVVTNGESKYVSLLLGNGDGTFQPQVEVSTGSPDEIAVADLNRDGKLDLVVITRCANLNKCFFQASVLLGNGDGAFAPQLNYVIPDGFAPEAISIGDVNGDGNLDLVTAVFNQTAQQTSVLLGDGTGMFHAHVDYAGGGFSVTLADFNQDGATDIAAGSGGLITMLLNTAGTIFKASASPNPVKQGQAVTFTVSIAASVVAQPVPTGTVALKEGSKTLATLTLAGGRAHIVTTKLGVGTHVITASYSGNSHFNPNSAQPITLVVNP